MSFFVCLVQIELHLPQNRSLKEKRKDLKSLKDRVRKRFGASVAETDHHAVLWWAPSGLLAVPVESWGRRGAGDPAGTGVLVSRIGVDTIEEVGTVTHPFPSPVTRPSRAADRTAPATTTVQPARKRARSASPSSNVSAKSSPAESVTMSVGLVMLMLLLTCATR